MPLHLRQRGDIWHARGTIRVGTQTVTVREFSTGCRARAGAAAVAAQREAEERAALLDGAAGRPRRLTVADCIAAYMRRPGGVEPYDVDRLADLNERIGAALLADAPAAWSEWLATRGAAMAPPTAARWRSILVAALNHGAKAHGATAPRLPGVQQRRDESVAYLTEPEAARLLAAYSPAARPVMTVLAYQGLRTQEALRLDWRHVQWGKRSLYVARSKSGRPRTVPMHRRVRVCLYRLWVRHGRPAAGPVFLSSRGEPYQDTRGLGGNPLRSAHRTACAAVGISGFRVHDWRHHWAAHMVMTGCDLYTLMRLGGWSTLRMVERYAAVSAEHMAAAVARLR